MNDDDKSYADRPHDEPYADQRPGTAFDEYERRLWTGKAEAYLGSFAKLCGYAVDALLDAAGVTSGTRLLDVGTGPGTAAKAALGRGAVVSAVDAEPSMVRLAARNADGADVRHALLPDLPFADDAFDAVVANFVLNHVGTPAAAVTELARVTRPGGTVAATIWPGASASAQRLWLDVVDAVGLSMRARPTVAPAADFERDPDGLAQLLRSHGLVDVEVRILNWHHRVDQWEWWSGPAQGMGPLGWALSGQPSEVVDRARAEYERLARPYHDGDEQLSLPSTAVLAWGRVPAGPTS